MHHERLGDSASLFRLTPARKHFVLVLYFCFDLLALSVNLALAVAYGLAGHIHVDALFAIKGRDWICGLVAFLWLYKRSRTLLSEELLIVSRVGVQVTTTRGFPWSTHLQSRHAVFLPRDAVQDVQIVEGISGWSVCYWLVLIAHHRHSRNLRIIVPFQNQLPKVNAIRPVWRDAQRLLHP